MNNSLSLSRKISIFLVPVIIILTAALIVRSEYFFDHSDGLSLGITLDLLVTMPVLYLILIRNTKISHITVVPLILVGLIVGTIVLPNQNQQYLNFFKTYLLPVLELSVLTFVILKVRATVKAYKANKDETSDFFTTLKKTVEEKLPKIAAIAVVTEIAMGYYAFVTWGKTKLKTNEFSYHKNGNALILLGFILFILIIETFVFHILLLKLSVVAAWILTGLSIYGAIQIFGFMKSIPRRPIVLTDDSLNLRYGIIKETAIPLANINRIEVSSKPVKDKSVAFMSLMGSMEGHNLILHLDDEVKISGLYGTSQKTKAIAFRVDQKDEFYHMLHDKIKLISSND